METIYQPRLCLLISRIKKMNLSSFILMATIAMYSTTLSSQCASPLTSFPISDDFETASTNWIQVLYNDFDCELKLGGIESSHSTTIKSLLSPTIVGNAINPKNWNL